MHEADAEIAERGDDRLTAAFCFEVVFRPLAIDTRLSGSRGVIPFEGQDIFFLHTPGHTPGSISVYVDTGGKRILFGQDLGAPLLKDFDCDPEAWRQSMEKLLMLKADVLCDGHSGVYQPAGKVTAYIRHFMDLYRGKGSDSRKKGAPDRAVPVPPKGEIEPPFLHGGRETRQLLCHRLKFSGRP